ncbi:MAG TPA: hypothetical protein VFY98_12375 [Intrasporangium sp.]|nr:hypothetical protein [Intrasporangium sp.]
MSESKSTGMRSRRPSVWTRPGSTPGAVQGLDAFSHLEVILLFDPATLAGSGAVDLEALEGTPVLDIRDPAGF